MNLEDSDPSPLDATPALPEEPAASPEAEERGSSALSEVSADPPGEGAGEGEGPPRFSWKLALTPEREPEQLGPYLLKGVIGRGAQGKVYRARDPRAGREVALKVLRSTSETARARFRREGQATAALNHPGIVRVHEAGESEGAAYVAYELVEDAHDLKALLRGTPAPAPEAVAGWVEEIARALGYAHSQGVVHRDLKPENVLVDSLGRLRVVDFGLARVRDATRLTESLAAVGTPFYMSPEQITGAREIGPQADVWALGVLLYEGFTGSYPFQGGTMVELGARVLSGHVTPPCELVPGLPPALGEVCLRALRVEVGERYPDGSSLADALSAASREPFAPAEARPARRALRWLLPLGLLGLLALSPLRTPSERLTAPPSAEAFQRALEEEDWERAEGLAQRALQAPLWEARLGAERQRSPSDLALQLEASGVPRARAAEVAALCSARAAFCRGERPYAALRAGAKRSSSPRSWVVAEAELLLVARRPRESRDLLRALPREPAPGLSEFTGARALAWCDPSRLDHALADLLATPPRVDSPTWNDAPPRWRRAARAWLLREGIALSAWAARARDRPYLPLPAGAPRAEAVDLLQAALTLGQTPELQHALAALDPALGALPPTGPEGTVMAEALRSAARAALGRGAPREALGFLERIQPVLLAARGGARGLLLGFDPQDPWAQVRRGQRASAWLRGRAHLALGEFDQATESLRAADPLSLPAALASRQAAQGAALGEIAALSSERVARLRRRDKGAAHAEIRRLRTTFKHGRAPLDETERAIQLDPLSDMGHATFAVSALLRGEAGPEPVLLVGEAWPWHSGALHREVFSVWTEGQDFGHLRRRLLPGIRERSSRLSQALIAAISLEVRGGEPAAALATLDRLEEVLDDAPGLLAARAARAFLLLRGGRIGAAEAELDWLRALQPRQGWGAFVRVLLIARQGASPQEVAKALTETGGFKTFREPVWSPALYPELRPVLKAPGKPVEAALRAHGWVPQGNF